MKNLVFAIWKPRGVSSNFVVNRVRRELGSRKVGHAGTLDPLAEGVLIVASGTQTKCLHNLVGERKEYCARIRLGATSTTDDAEGDIAFLENPHSVTRDDIEKVAEKYVGDILQTPPIFSALRIKGKRAYDLARDGKNFELAPRNVRIDGITIESYEWPILEVTIQTGKGVYIRSLARDIGRDLGVGGYLVGLIRTRVGTYTRLECVESDDLENYLRSAPSL